MEKETKNLGIRKACPVCRKVIFVAGEFSGKGSFKTKCPHCQSLVLIQINAFPVIKLTACLVIALALFAIYIFSSGLIQYIKAKKSINCSIFKIQADAQSLFNIDPVKYVGLDKDHDGIPCESLLLTK